MQSRISGDKARQPLRGAKNIRLVIAFDGTCYSGWQIQPDRPTVQGIVREAIKKISGEPVKLIGSGRTDSGTHARGLVANFLTTSRMPPASWVPALNRLLPPDIRVLSARRAPSSFHARLSARSKIYRYQIYRGNVLPPHHAREYFHYPFPLNVDLMKRASMRFVGEHDFASFAAHTGEKVRGKMPAVRAEGNAVAHTEQTPPEFARDTVRKISSCRLDVRGRRLIFQVEGNGFLHHMVRNMVGTLLEVGRGRISAAQFEELLRTRDRTRAGFTAPAHGLVLVKVRY